MRPRKSPFDRINNLVRDPYLRDVGLILGIIALCVFMITVVFGAV